MTASAVENRVTITYCTGCRWLLRAAWMAQELLTTLESDIGEIALCPGSDGIFQVHANGTCVWCRGADGGFPAIPELKRRVRDVVAPERSLGHSDK